ncbi:protein white-like [Daphnia carinata]|uniref:protein white-like n=1 Tax=Daphnia carinata TaxID=120202 RepID=UPI00257A16D4|nr:protein white-like [Daphnia carinata]
MDLHTEKNKDGHSLNPTFVNLGFDDTGEIMESSRKSSLGEKKDSSITLRRSQPVTYSWENIEIYLEKKQGNCFKRQPPIQKRILDNVTGCVRPGEFLAIMGASGAGKTTLLNCLTFRNTGKLKITGERFLNGAKVNTDTLARISGYVQQDDLFIPTLTVKEHLEFQALLRMEKHLSYDERMIRVGEVIHELGLRKCENTVIGNPERGIKGISGGERKRLAFASEVLTNPSLMFCDEPTSGLDSYMAQNIVQVLKNIASTGKTVVCTIHQPSSEVFALFDRILLMAEGRTAFLGPVSEALNFFSARGLPCPSNYNPADYYIHTLATVPGQEVDSRKKSKDICDAYESSQAGQQVLEIVKANRSLNSTESQEFELAEVKAKKSPYKASWFAQFRAVLWRSVIAVVREPVVLRVKAFQTIFISAIIALIYQGQTLEFDNVRNIQGALFIFLTNMTFQNVFGVVNAITGELPIFLREHFNGMYRTDVYFICKSIADLPLFILFPFLFVLIPYFAIGLNPAADRFFIACGITILVANVASSFGFMISCLAGSTDVALALAPPLVIPLLLFGGFFLSNEDVPVYFDWMRYISWFMYGNEALSINQWVGISFNDTSCPDNMCTGEQILASFDFNPDYFYRDIGGLFALILAFRILAFLALLRKTYRKN